MKIFKSKIFLVFLFFFSLFLLILLLPLPLLETDELAEYEMLDTADLLHPLVPASGVS